MSGEVLDKIISQEKYLYDYVRRNTIVGTYSKYIVLAQLSVVLL